MIEPVLTREEWAVVRDTFATGKGAFMFRADLFGWPVENRPGLATALANFLLPDDDPRKITRADVEEISDAASAMENADVWGQPDPPGGSPLRLIAAKLAALLPPDA